MTKLVVAMMALSAVAEVSAADTKQAGAAGGSSAPVSADARRVVQAFVGTWTFSGAVTGMPGADKPARATETTVCRKAAGGRGVVCNGKGNVAGQGAFEDELMVMWDDAAKNLRIFGIDSLGEIHDHTCSWKDDRSIGCEPLSVTGEGGQPATVELQIAFADAKHMNLSETTTAKDGSKSTFEGKATRR